MAQSANNNLDAFLVRLEETNMMSAIEGLKAAQAAVGRLSHPRTENRRSVVKELAGMSPEFYAFLFRQANIEPTDSLTLSLSMAIDKLGFDRLKRMVLYHVASSMDEKATEADRRFSDYLWRMNYRVGYTAAHWLQGFSRELSEAAFFMGLLQNIGISAFVRLEPSRHRGLRESKRKEPLATKERDNFGFSHYDLGRAIVQKWGLPRAHCSALSYEETHGQATFELANEDEELVFLLIYAARFKAERKASLDAKLDEPVLLDPYFGFDKNLLEFAAERIGEIAAKAG